MLKKIGTGLLYVGPPSFIFGIFAAGHITLAPQTNRLENYRIENGLISPPEPRAEPANEADQIAKDETVERDVEGRIIPPAYRYFSFTMPFSANIGTTRRLFSMEVSVSVFGSPFVGDTNILRLQELEAQLRPVVLEQMQGMTEDEIRDPAVRKQLALRIRDALNATFASLGENIELKAAMITSVVLT